MYHTEIQLNLNLIPVVYIETCDTVMCTDHPWGLRVHLRTRTHAKYRV